MGNRFNRRSGESELMDLPNELKEDLFINLKELELINKLTGGPSLVFSAIKKMLANETREVHIVDIGFGAGDMLQYLLDHAEKLPFPIRLTGVDLLPEAAEYAKKTHPGLCEKVNFETCDYRDWFSAGNKPDLIIASLFCHHLTDHEITGFFADIKSNATIGGVINDLVRSPIAYYGIKIPTQLFSKSRFTKNDAPLSVLRGFKRNELEALLKNAGIKNYSLEWKWAFRYLISIRNNE
ncbi:MAG: methyltransferase domain-containing protein [Bacteroidetes bacterium]|nr:methyltransferase domain-containing protein [Bacteroidota bacterium]HET6244116.1 methyltransferase domain-containing protein [Bacteroidia bacterium]